MKKMAIVAFVLALAVACAKNSPTEPNRDLTPEELAKVNLYIAAWQCEGVFACVRVWGNHQRDLEQQYPTDDSTQSLVLRDFSCGESSDKVWDYSSRVSNEGSMQNSPLTGFKFRKLCGTEAKFELHVLTFKDRFIKNKLEHAILLPQGAYHISNQRMVGPLAPSAPSPFSSTTSMMSSGSGVPAGLEFMVREMTLLVQEPVQIRLPQDK